MTFLKRIALLFTISLLISSCDSYKSSHRSMLDFIDPSWALIYTIDDVSQVEKDLQDNVTCWHNEHNKVAASAKKDILLLASFLTLRNINSPTQGPRHRKQCSGNCQISKNNTPRQPTKSKPSKKRHCLLKNTLER